MMKSLSSVLLILICFSANAQCLLSTDISLTSQQDITNFRENNCSCATIEITGKLSVQGPDITDLSLLNFITSVSDSVNIINNPLLANLDGLDAIVTVGMDLNIFSNPLLTNLSGLGGLTTVGAYISVADNAALTSLSGLTALSSADGIYLAANTSLADISALTQITALPGGLNIEDNPALISLAGLNNLTSVGYVLGIASNTALTNLQGLEKLTLIDGQLAVSGNSALLSLKGLENVTSIGGVAIVMNALLQDLADLSNLTSVDGQFAVISNPVLASLTSLKNLTTIAGDFIIIQNPEIITLQGLDNLDEIDGYLFVGYNEKLTTLKGLEKLVDPGVTNVAILGNTALTSLQGLENLTTIQGGLSIIGNETLASLSGLAKLSVIPGDLEISQNTLLQTCATPVICALLASSPTGSVIIEDNNTGCNSVIEVENACQALPVTLVNFEVKSKFTENNKTPSAQLKWSTTSETNSARFEIQRSADKANSWLAIGSVNAKGESSSNTGYSFLDENPANGENLYRLKMIDKDASFAYSRIVAIRFENAMEVLSVYPNPVADLLFVRNNNTSDLIKIEMFTDAGKKVFDSGKAIFMGKGVSEMNFKKYSKGMYLLQLTSENGTVSVRKVVKE